MTVFHPHPGGLETLKDLQLRKSLYTVSLRENDGFPPFMAPAVVAGESQNTTEHSVFLHATYCIFPMWTHDF